MLAAGVNPDGPSDIPRQSEAGPSQLSNANSQQMYEIISYRSSPGSMVGGSYGYVPTDHGDQGNVGQYAQYLHISHGFCECFFDINVDKSRTSHLIGLGIKPLQHTTEGSRPVRLPKSHPLPPF